MNINSSLYIDVKIGDKLVVDGQELTIIQIAQTFTSPFFICRNKKGEQLIVVPEVTYRVTKTPTNFGNNENVIRFPLGGGNSNA